MVLCGRMHRGVSCLACFLSVIVFHHRHAVFTFWVSAASGNAAAAAAAAAAADRPADYDDRRLCSPAARSAMKTLVIAAEKALSVVGSRHQSLVRECGHGVIVDVDYRDSTCLLACFLVALFGAGKAPIRNGLCWCVCFGVWRRRSPGSYVYIHTYIRVRPLEKSRRRAVNACDV